MSEQKEGVYFFFGNYTGNFYTEEEHEEMRKEKSNERTKNDPLPRRYWECGAKMGEEKEK